MVRNFEESGDVDHIGQREPSFQSHVLVASTAAISIHTAPTPTPLAKSASTTSAVLRSIVPPPRTNALARSSSSSQANRPLPPPPRSSRAQFHQPLSPLSQSASGASMIQQETTVTANMGKVMTDSPNLIDL